MYSIENQSICFWCLSFWMFCIFPSFFKNDYEMNEDQEHFTKSTLKLQIFHYFWKFWILQKKKHVGYFNTMYAWYLGELLKQHNFNLLQAKNHHAWFERKFTDPVKNVKSNHYKSLTRKSKSQITWKTSHNFTLQKNYHKTNDKR